MPYQQMRVDRGDILDVFRWNEDPKQYEQLVLDQLERAAGDPAVARILQGNYISADPETAFLNYFRSYEFSRICRLLEIFRVSKDAAICEIGGGPGFVSWSLVKAGFENVSLLEPNHFFHTGSGFLRSLPEQPVRIVNDLNGWYSDVDSKYDLILTRNCIHHFQNISATALALRGKLASGGRWFAWREQFARDTSELFDVLSTHPYTRVGKLYEFAYSPEHYIDAIEFAGFELKAVVPRRYANQALITFELSEGDRRAQLETARVERMLRDHPARSVRRLNVERFSNRYLRGAFGSRNYSAPSGFLFSRVEFPSFEQPVATNTIESSD